MVPRRVEDIQVVVSSEPELINRPLNLGDKRTLEILISRRHVDPSVISFQLPFFADISNSYFFRIPPSAIVQSPINKTKAGQVFNVRRGQIGFECACDFAQFSVVH